MSDTFQAFPFPRERGVTVDGGRIASWKHPIYALIEIDVTKPRRLIREHKERTGESLSFTAFIITCLGKAVDADRRVQAYRDWRNRLIVFDDVDVNTMIEIEMPGRKMVLPHFVRAANKRTLREIHDEIRTVQTQPKTTREFGVRWFVYLPQFARDIFYWFVFRNPSWLKKTFCTVGLTSVGMFGMGGGWAIPFLTHTLDIAVGGIANKPALVDGRIESHEYLCLTICFDHDIVDGAPATRFAARFKELIESGYGLN